jgi:cytochrome c556
MKDNAMKKFIALLTTTLFFTTQTAQAAEPLALQQVMKDLGKNMQTVTDGISREDWLLVEKASRNIGEHPQVPPTEKMRIMSFMGSDMARFKELDGKTHLAAHEMAEAAQARDGQKVIASFQKLQSACLACHQSFRPAFVKHFYENTK